MSLTSTQVRRNSSRSRPGPHSRVWLFAVPGMTLFAAFWLLPMLRLVGVGASGPTGAMAYLAVVEVAKRGFYHWYGTAKPGRPASQVTKVKLNT